MNTKFAQRIQLADFLCDDAAVVAWFIIFLRDPIIGHFAYLLGIVEVEYFTNMTVL